MSYRYLVFAFLKRWESQAKHPRADDPSEPLAPVVCPPLQAQPFRRSLREVSSSAVVAASTMSKKREKRKEDPRWIAIRAAMADGVNAENALALLTLAIGCKITTWEDM